MKLETDENLKKIDSWNGSIIKFAFPIFTLYLIKRNLVFLMRKKFINCGREKTQT